MAGRAAVDAAALLASQRLSIAIEALGRTYDYALIDAGMAPDASLERLAMLAPRAILVTDADDAATTVTRERLLEAGFANVSVLAGAPDARLGGAKAAA
jgi:hypothetical protein